MCDFANAISNSESELTRGWKCTVPYTPDIQICSWEYVTCSRGFVSSLSLSALHLIGTIPTSVGNLKYIKQLSLNENSFHGILPDSLSASTNMISLMLSHNSIIGTIPSTYGSLRKLTQFKLKGNLFSGTLSAELAKMSSLQYMELSDNKLVGAIPKNLGQLSSTLRILYLANNKLSGAVPVELCKLTSLIAPIDVSGN
ncbi:unnamed protein product, partial [Ectocarpus fasciculatus]